ncbi:hypothetical protein [Streptomyces klenkii]
MLAGGEAVGDEGAVGCADAAVEDDEGVSVVGRSDEDVVVVDESQMALPGLGA